VITTNENNPLLATDPKRHASVQASAGTGKTWMLITRILRLLLHGVEPGKILALTFTRKAAAEMLTRLNERARHWSCSSEKELISELKQIGLTPDTQLIKLARSLYESLLYTPYPVRISTFHAFAQDLLLRFPLEAEIPPGFELLTNSFDIEIEAWNRLNEDLGKKQKSDAGQRLKYLYQQCGSADNTKNLLSLFLNSRIEWWAYTQNKENNITFACQQLEQLLLLKEHKSLSIDEYIDTIFTPTFITQLERLSELLARHNKSTTQKQVTNIAITCDIHRNKSERFSACCTALFKKDGSPFNISKTIEKSIGESDGDEFHNLHDTLCRQASEHKNIIERLKIYHLSKCWFIIGNHYLTLFQKIKSEHRVLDYSDLEWKAYLLLNHSDNAHWVQYKLDQRIDHLLVDEFQDTNPIQWQMILPFLNEIASTESEQIRSTFVVGDKKQSIYQFRRANPKLLDEASEWLNNHLNARSFTLASSRRSSPAIINLVNQVFAVNHALADFETHSTYLDEMWGKVTILPLCKEPEGKAEIQAFRNPLLDRKASREQERYVNEADKVVSAIQALINNKALINDQGIIRPARYSDIMILMRKRTHAHYFEKKLTEQKIPFIGVEGGTLLNCLEVKDLCSLLSILVNPYDNLQLAQVLRSPIFDFSEYDLLDIATHASSSWYHYLQECYEDDSSSKLSKCFNQLEQWRQLTGILPVHDLLDQLYFQINIVARYEKVFPEALKSRVRVNFAKFIDIALEMDSGRYPSVTRFIQYIKTLKQNPAEAPDSPPGSDDSERVKLLTVHSAKGLEAPIVFLIDACEQKKPSNSFYTCLNWPSDSKYPTQFFVYPASLKDNQTISPALTPQALALKQEDANLLYVALTRAKQYLFVSGSVGTRQKEMAWYGQLENAVNLLCENSENKSEYHFADIPMQSQPTKLVATDANLKGFNSWIDLLKQEQPPEPEPEQNLKTEPQASLELNNAPSESKHENDDLEELIEIQTDKAEDATAQNKAEHAAFMGSLIHRILELKLSTQASSDDQIKTQLKADSKFSCVESDLSLAWSKAQATLDKPDFAAFFNPKYFEKAYNEIPLCYFNKSEWFNGIIDRLIVNKNEILIIDYKSHQFSENEIPEVTALNHKEQLDTYEFGIKNLWPNYQIKKIIIFTDINVACTL